MQKNLDYLLESKIWEKGGKFIPPEYLFQVIGLGQPLLQPFESLDKHECGIL